jgi:ABC-type transporter MlaC component
MKSIVIALVVMLSASAFAGPAEVVKTAFNQVVDVVKTGDENAQIRTMCTLAKTSVDLDYVTAAVLGAAAKSNETQALAELRALIPSVIVTDLMNVASYFENGIIVDPKPIPRAGRAKGVRMDIEIDKENNNFLKFVVVVIPSADTWKIVNLEIVSYRTDILNLKKQQFADKMKEATSNPVAYLVDSLRKDSDLVHCQ